MFKQETVFIIGAGASCHNGYPTGEQLVQRVIQNAHQLSRYLSEARMTFPAPLYVAENPPTHPGIPNYRAAASECLQLATQLEEINPLVIDYFLADHPKLRRIGKLMIALVLLECEGQYEAYLAKTDRNAQIESGHGDWYRFLIHRLTIGCTSPEQLCENKVTFVTFNYDTSLAERLARNLNSIERFGEREAARFFQTPRILHVYGSLRTVLSRGAETQPYPMLNKAWSAANHPLIVHVLNTAYEASKRLSTIAPDDKGANENELIAAREAIERAKFVYILGYGFDQENSRLLYLDSLLRYDHATRAKEGKRIMFTNYHDSNRVNKEASRLYFGNRRQIYSGSPFIIRDDAEEIYIERSDRDVYGAFNLDFDAPEQMPD